MEAYPFPFVFWAISSYSQNVIALGAQVMMQAFRYKLPLYE
jgi:hypothetical protein